MIFMLKLALLKIKKKKKIRLSAEMHHKEQKCHRKPKYGTQRP